MGDFIQELLEKLKKDTDGMMLMEPRERYDACVVGLALGDEGVVAVYSTDKIVAVLMLEDGMEEDEAEEFIDFNMRCAYVGGRTPTFI